MTYEINNSDKAYRAELCSILSKALNLCIIAYTEYQYKVDYFLLPTSSKFCHRWKKLSNIKKDIA